MKNKYFLSRDKFLYRKSANETAFWYGNDNCCRWRPSAYFLHLDIAKSSGHIRISRDAARKWFPKAFRKKA